MSTTQTKTIMALVENFIANIDERVGGESFQALWVSEKSKFETLLVPLLSKGKASKTDPAKPKRATTTYQLYMATHRQEVVDDGFEQKDVMSELARRYNIEKDAESDEYMELVAEAQTDKDRYTEEMKSYVPTPGFEPKRKDPNAPKRAKSTYNIFCEENRPSVKENNPEMAQSEIMSELGRLWKEMDPDDDDFERLKGLAVEDKKRYTKAMESYVRPPESELPVPRKRGGSGGVKSKKIGPAKATSAYMFFRNERVTELGDAGMSSKDIADEVIAAWNELKEDEELIATYNDMAAEDKARYEKEKAEWDAKKGAQSQSDSDNSGDDHPVKEPVMKRPVKSVDPVKGKSPKKQLSTNSVTSTMGKKPSAGSNTAYIAFCKANRGKMKEQKPGLVGKELTVQLQRAWKKLSIETQAEWAQ